MSAQFEDDVEPVDEPLMRNAGGSRTGNNGNNSTLASGSTSRIPTPEPDEDLDTTDGKQNMWLVKVPRFLLEGWTKVDEEDKCLGTVRVYDADHKGRQRMELHLPQEPEPAIPLPPSHPYLQTNFPRQYDMNLTSEQEGVRVRNLYAFKERLEGVDEDEDDDDFDSGTESKYNRSGSASLSGGRKRGRRVVSMVGKIANEASVKPQIAPAILRSGAGGSASGLTPEYREVLRKRRLEAQKPRHSVKILDDSDRSRTNMLTSGVMAHTNKSTKASLIAGTSQTNTGRKIANTNNERFARLPRNELLDMLFELYDQYPYWSIKGLRQKVQQPEVYLRDVLSSIADLHKRGPYSGNWSLKPEFVEMRKQQDREAQQNANAAAAANVAFANALGSSSTVSQQQISIGGTPSIASSSGQQQGQTNSANVSQDAPQTKVKEEDGNDEDDEDDLEMEDVA